MGAKAKEEKESKASVLPEQIKKVSDERLSKIETALGAEKDAKSESGWKSQAALKKISRYQRAVDQAKAEGRCSKKEEEATGSVLEEDDKTTITTTKAAAKEGDDSGKGKSTGKEKK